MEPQNLEFLRESSNFFSKPPALTLLHDDFYFNKNISAPPNCVETNEPNQDSVTKNESVNSTFSEVKTETVPLSNENSNTTEKVDVVSTKKNSIPYDVESENYVIEQAKKEFNTILRQIPIQLLFRSCLSRPAICHEDELWFHRQEDVVLSNLAKRPWEEKPELSGLYNLLKSVPSTTSVYYELCAKRLSQGVIKCRNFVSKEKEDHMLETRSLLEKHGIMRDVEELRTRENSLSIMKITLESRNVFLLTGGKVYPLPQLVKFPTPTNVYPSDSRSIFWSCLMFPLNHMKKVFEKLQPPVLYLPSYDQTATTDEIKKYCGLPCLQFPIAVANYFALAVELKVKVTMSALIKKITANATPETKCVITMDTIREALLDSTLKDFPWDKPHVMRECRFHYIERNIKRLRPEDTPTPNEKEETEINFDISI
ncbi:uncharacterized protein LOC128882679 isoform X2 [Hylaeus volcanicus]|uniref:uncharacterized protein LOC128882679 isoform X2 n=1 Tax=Hylaeus volcanicus TaxID=313075 RepID=UPI0023B83E60|nr:uncharacterized protein LOC128882679 isoform X2 [Hylaeus volcanicus]